MKYLILLWLLIPAPVMADSVRIYAPPEQVYGSRFQMFNLDLFSFETYKIEDHRDVDFLPPSNDWQAGTAVNFNLALAQMGPNKIYWENTVRGDAVETQYRSVSWWYELGYSFNERIQLYWEHESEHALDQKTYSDFPLSNRYGVRVTFYKRD